MNMLVTSSTLAAAAALPVGPSIAAEQLDNVSDQVPSRVILDDDRLFAAIEWNRKARAEYDVAQQEFCRVESGGVILGRDTLSASVKVPVMGYDPSEQCPVETGRTIACFDHEDIDAMVPKFFSAKQRRNFVRKWRRALAAEGRRLKKIQDESGWTAADNRVNAAIDERDISRATLALTTPRTAAGARALLRYWWEMMEAELTGTGNSVEWDQMQDTLRLLTSLWSGIGTIADMGREVAKTPAA